MIPAQKITHIISTPTQNADNTYSVHYSYIDTKTNVQKTVTLNYRYKIDALSVIKRLQAKYYPYN